MSTYQLGAFRTVLFGVMVFAVVLSVGAAVLFTPAGVAYAWCDEYDCYEDEYTGEHYDPSGGYYEWYAGYNGDGTYLESYEGWDAYGNYINGYEGSDATSYYDGYDTYGYGCDYSCSDDSYTYDSGGCDEYSCSGGYVYDDYCDNCYGDDYYFYGSGGGSVGGVSGGGYYTIGSGGARYSSSGGSYSVATPSYNSAPMTFANIPSYIPSYAPTYQPNTPTVTNIDNSIRDSFNDYSTNIIGSFNNNAGSFNADSTVIGATTWGSVTPIASVTPGYTIAAVTPSYTSTYVPSTPVNQRYVSLSQIPYTGFDYGPVGNAMYWMTLVSLALAGGYMLVYFKGGVLAFAGSMLPRRKETREEIELPSISFETTPVVPVAESRTEEKAVNSATKDTMRLSENGIVIDRNF